MNEDILYQVTKVMDILQKHYQSGNHPFIFDNATTHLKQVDTALSTHKMPKNIPRHGRNWGVGVRVLDGNGEPVFNPNGKGPAQKSPNGDATFVDSRLQCLYFPKYHP